MQAHCALVLSLFVKRVQHTIEVIGHRGDHTWVCRTTGWLHIDVSTLYGSSALGFADLGLHGGCATWVYATVGISETYKLCGNERGVYLTVGVSVFVCACVHVVAVVRQCDDISNGGWWRFHDGLPPKAANVVASLTMCMVLAS